MGGRKIDTGFLEEMNRVAAWKPKASGFLMFENGNFRD